MGVNNFIYFHHKYFYEHQKQIKDTTLGSNISKPFNIPQQKSMFFNDDKSEKQQQQKNKESDDESILYSSDSEIKNNQQKEYKAFHAKHIIKDNNQSNLDENIDEDSDELKQMFQFDYKEKQQFMEQYDQQTIQVNQKFDLIKQQYDVNESDDSDDTIRTNDVLSFIDDMDIKDLLSTNQMNQNQYKGINKQQQYQLKGFYFRSLLFHTPQEQEKRAKFDAKQEQIQEQSLNSESSVSDEDGPSDKLYQPSQFLADVGIAVQCKKGNKNQGPHMNDYFIYNDQYNKIICLVNGHGEFGHLISNIIQRMVFQNLLTNAQFYTNITKALNKILYELQDDIRKYIEKKKKQTYNCILSGCVITVIVQRENKIYFGHIGDNRLTVYKDFQNLNKQRKALIELTPLHCPIDQLEKVRIFNGGGEVRNYQNDEYVYVRGRLFPQLHVTRSIGDLIGHIIGVSSIPYVNEYQVNLNDTFLVISTNSAFQYMEQDEIVNHLNGFTLRNIRQACESLYKRAKSSWFLNEGVIEDMTIILVWLGSIKDYK